ncbi:MAG TPA: FAD synthetase family protein [Rectinemataceae bacterium]
MILYSWEEFLKGSEGPPWSVTVGVFDGVHLGHKRLIQRVREMEPQASSAVVTFRDNPKRVLHPASYRGSLMTLEQKLDALEACGLGACVLIDFSADFGTLSGAAFLAGLAAAGTRYLSIGPNFRCGHRMDADAEAVEKICASLGIRTGIVEPLMRGSHPISSSRIRNAILEGRLDEAEAMLGRPYSLALEGEWSQEAGGWAVEVAEGAVLPPEGLYSVAPPGRGIRSVSLLRNRRLFIEGVDPRGVRELFIIDSVERE